MTRNDMTVTTSTLLNRSWSRRALTAVAAGLAVGGAAPGRAGARESTPAASPVAGGWTFTDDAGNTVTLPERPTRIVADLNAASALWDFGIRPVAVTGWTTATDAAWGNVDRSTPDISAGPETGSPDPEKYLAVNPDLFVTIVWGDEATPYNWTFSDEGSYERLGGIAPVIGISGSGSADKNAERFAELAALLGADLATPELLAAKTTYDETVAAFKALAAEKANLTSLFGYIDSTSAYLAYPPIWADLAMYRSFGLNVVVPERVPDNDYWLEISPELVATYPSDLFFVSTRTGVLTPAELQANAAYDRQPAIGAGQIGLWNQDFIQSYQGLTIAMNDLMEVLREAKKVTG